MCCSIVPPVVRICDLLERDYAKHAVDGKYASRVHISLVTAVQIIRECNKNVTQEYRRNEQDAKSILEQEGICPGHHRRALSVLVDLPDESEGEVPVFEFDFD